MSEEFLHRALRLLYGIEHAMDPDQRTELLNLEMDVRLSEVKPPATEEKLTGIEKEFASRHTF